MDFLKIAKVLLSIGQKALEDKVSMPTEKSVKEDLMKEKSKCGGKLFHHEVLTVEESRINRLLRAIVRGHWFFHSVIVEFEPNNHMYLGAITKFGNVMSANMKIVDLWFDDYTTSFELKIDISSVDTGNFILNTIVHTIGKWLMSLMGMFFNPFSIGKYGSNLRFDKNGCIRFDLIPNSALRSIIVWPKREPGAEGPVLVYNPKTMQAAMTLDYYSFYKTEERFVIADMPSKTSWLHSIDWIALLLLPVGVWVSFVILHTYLPPQTLQTFSWSFYFWMSLGMLWMSFMVMNIPRYIYMYFQGRNKWQSALIHNNISIQMRRLQRRILNLQSLLKSEDVESEEDYQEKIRQLLLQIRDKRFVMQRLKAVDEDHLRKQKVKFVVAYILCTLFEWFLLVK